MSGWLPVTITIDISNYYISKKIWDWTGRLLYVFGKYSDFPLNIENWCWLHNTVATITLLAAAVLRSVRSCRHLPRGGGLRGAGRRVARLHARGPGPGLVRCETLHLLQVGGGFRPRFPRPVNFWNIAKIWLTDSLFAFVFGLGGWLYT